MAVAPDPQPPTETTSRGGTHSNVGCLSCLESTVPLGGVSDEVADALGVTPLVVVPGDELDEVGGELDTSIGVEDRGAVVAGEIGGDNLLVGVSEDTLHGGLGGGLACLADLGVGSGLLEADDEVNNGDIDGGDTESKSTVRQKGKKLKL